MLALLTDEQITPDVTEQVRLKRSDIVIHSLHQWQRGTFRGKTDALLLAAAHKEGLTLLTYDQKTIPPLLTELAHAEEEHSGVVFVDEETVASNDLGGLVRAVISFYERCQEWDWKNRISFLDADQS